MAEKRKSPGPPEGKVQLSFHVRKELHQRVKVHAAKKGTSITALIEGWIEKHCPKV